MPRGYFIDVLLLANGLVEMGGAILAMTFVATT
jgi:hypothetical protein